MKKILILFVMIGSLFLVGCGKYGEKDIIKDLSKKIDNIKGYHLNGILEIVNNEESYLYDVDVSYEKQDKYRVSLKNQTNNHEQIILKNEEAVYVLTPSLNKSFKFQSQWPYNNSQIYLLQTILTDLKNEKDRSFEVKDNNYIFETQVNYSNNPDLVKQKITMDKKLKFKVIEIYNKDDVMQMKMEFKDIDMKASFDDDYFTLKENMNNISNTSDMETSKIEDTIYPMYLPTNTHLESQDKVTTETGERVILTFNGDKPFMLVQESSAQSKELLTVPMYGEPYMFADTVAALSDNSVTWISNDIEYYVVSDVLSKEELVNVAKSISTIPVSK